ncbi:hypothetical protein BU17DRAFT_60339 [Hysterangium stoloniferum]|nr:hypothetical protein BU17DRAFT_60339 [Hysterangium stoloniferum]
MPIFAAPTSIMHVTKRTGITAVPPLVDAGVEVPAPSVISRQLPVPPGNGGGDIIPVAALIGSEFEQMMNQSRLLAGNLVNQLQDLADRGQFLTDAQTNAEGEVHQSVPSCFHGERIPQGRRSKRSVPTPFGKRTDLGDVIPFIKAADP